MQAYRQGIDQAQPVGAEVEVGYGPIELNVTTFDHQKPLASHTWDSARLRIFVDKSGKYPRFRVLIYRDSSLVSNYTGKICHGPFNKPAR